MSHIVVTGATDGLGRITASRLLAADHTVVVHARRPDRLTGIDGLLRRGAVGVTGDLADSAQTIELADQINQLGRPDAVIHNAGVNTGRGLLQVNVLAPYLLTALVHAPARLIYLSSSMHAGGSAQQGLRALRGEDGARASYGDTKLLLTTLAAAVARRWPDVLSNAVDPGWVPTRMGGPGAPDDLELGAATQTWLATSDDPEAITSGGYWHHQRVTRPHPSVNDHAFQDELLQALADATGYVLVTPPGPRPSR